MAAWAHEEFVSIHPFVDGNGRIARLIMNYILLSYDCLPISVPIEKKKNTLKCWIITIRIAILSRWLN
ncbi:MAG: Fic family protein [Eisenbergiella sp.]